jgi:hypothetical protein
MSDPPGSIEPPALRGWLRRSACGAMLPGGPAHQLTTPTNFAPNEPGAGSYGLVQPWLMRTAPLASIAQRAAHDRPRGRETMQRFPSIAFLSLFLALQPPAASARAIHAERPADWNTCALEAQRAVARRHSLADSGDGTLASRIYADPKMSGEADSAFDDCVRNVRR